MPRNDVSLLIREIPADEAPLELLLIADPSEDKVRSYLPRSICFVAQSNGAVVGACAVLPLKAGVYELMSIAVHPDHQKCGYGGLLLKWVIGFFPEIRRVPAGGWHRLVWLPTGILSAPWFSGGPH